MLLCKYSTNQQKVQQTPPSSNNFRYCFSQRIQLQGGIEFPEAAKCLLSRDILISQEETSHLTKVKQVFKPTLKKDGTLCLSYHCSGNQQYFVHASLIFTNDTIYWQCQCFLSGAYEQPMSARLGTVQSEGVILLIKFVGQWHIKV